MRTDRVVCYTRSVDGPAVGKLLDNFTATVWEMLSCTLFPAVGNISSLDGMEVDGQHTGLHKE